MVEIRNNAKPGHQPCKLRNSPQYPVRQGEWDTVNVKQLQGCYSSQTMQSGDYVLSNQLCWLEGQTSPLHVCCAPKGV
jgi:hypothetical protein